MKKPYILGEEIAEELLKTPTEERGDVFFHIARGLEKRTQFYTASLFYAISKEYGTKEKP